MRNFGNTNISTPNNKETHGSRFATLKLIKYHPPFDTINTNCNQADLENNVKRVKIAYEYLSVNWIHHCTLNIPLMIHTDIGKGKNQILSFVS